jgi:1-acyl-sn-glycerol-3-phosphate acyltransferase
MNDLSPIRITDAALRQPAPDLQSLAVEVVRRAMAQKGGAAVPTVRDVLRRRLPFMRWLDRLVLCALMLFVRRQIVKVSGIEHILTPHPSILALNHSTRREAVVVPAVLIFHRGGRLIHFWSDWMFRLIPALGFLMRRAGTIVVATKPSRLPWVNLLKPLFERRPSAMEQARVHLDARRPVGVFPEGTVSRDP